VDFANGAPKEKANVSVGYEFSFIEYKHEQVDIKVAFQGSVSV
jgi:hypothetical protein